MAPDGLTTQTNASNEIALINEHLTGPPAEILLRKSGLLETPQSTSPDILDNASGIGTLIFRLLKLSGGRDFGRIVGADIDEKYLSFLRERAATTGASSVETVRLDQQLPGFDSDSFDYIFNNFGVFFAPNDAAVLAETLKMLKPGGFAGFTSWVKISWWDEILLPALKFHLPGAPALPDPSKLFTPGWSDPQTARMKLETAGFADVHSEVYTFTPNITPEAFSQACAHLVKAVTARVWDASARVEFEPSVEKSLRDYLYMSFDSGRWTGTMSAVVTFGVKR